MVFRGAHKEHEDHGGGSEDQVSEGDGQEHVGDPSLTADGRLPPGRHGRSLHLLAPERCLDLETDDDEDVEDEYDDEGQDRVGEQFEIFEMVPHEGVADHG